MRKIVERKVEWHPKTIKGISQIPKDGVEFAFVSEDYRQVHQLVWCKDFMQDTIFGFLNDTQVQIYGFEYDPQKNPAICKNKTRLMVCNWRDQSFKQKFSNNCREFLHGLESLMKMRKSRFEKCINPPPIYRRSGVFIIDGSPRWMMAPPMISFYTLMIRIGMVHPLGQSSLKTLEKIRNGSLKPYNWKPDVKGKWGDIHEDNDQDHLISGWDGVQAILKLGDRNLFRQPIYQNYLYDVGVETIHDDCGLGGFTSGCTEDYFPRWHKHIPQE